MDRPRILGVLAGEDLPLALLKQWAESADVVLAADGGANRLREIGLVPSATIGDLDSIESAAREHQARLIHDRDQDTSDCDKLLALADRLGYGEITLASLEGDLLDHLVGSLSSALASPLQVRLALRRGVGWLLKDATTIDIDCSPGARVSLLPLNRSIASMSGVEWPIEEYEMALGGKTSLSNRATNSTIRVRQSEGASLLFVAYDPTDLPRWSR